MPSLKEKNNVNTLPRNDTLGTLFDYLRTLGVEKCREREMYFSLVDGDRMKRFRLHGVCVPCSGPVEIRLLECTNEEEAL